MSDIRRVLVLGHSGFIGTRVCKQFEIGSPGIERVGRSLPELDLTRHKDAKSLAGLMDRDTAVIMLSGIKRQLGDNMDAFEKNLKMVINLVRLLEKHPVARVLFISSAAVYGEETDDTCITEDTPVRLMSCYGIAKYVSECLVRKVCDQDERMSLVCVRPPLVYGPGDASKGYGPAGFARSAVEGREIILWGDGTELREFIFVDDLAGILHDLTFSDYDGVLNAASGESRSFREILDILNAEFGGALQIRSRERTKEKVNNAFSNRRLMEVLPGVAFTSLRDGMKCTIEAERRGGSLPSGCCT